MIVRRRLCRLSFPFVGEIVRLETYIYLFCDLYYIILFLMCELYILVL